jgi:hypothetical protein
MPSVSHAYLLDWIHDEWKLTDGPACSEFLGQFVFAGYGQKNVGEQLVLILEDNSMPGSRVLSSNIQRM